MFLDQGVVNRSAIEAPPSVESDVAGVISEILELLVDHQAGTALTAHCLPPGKTMCALAVARLHHTRRK